MLKYIFIAWIRKYRKSTHKRIYLTKTVVALFSQVHLTIWIVSFMEFRKFQNRIRFVNSLSKYISVADTESTGLLSEHIVYPKKYAHGFVVLCFVVVTQSFIMNSHEVYIHIHQGCFAGTGAIVRLPQCQLSKPDGYWKISQCITTTKHSKAKTVCIFLGIYCNKSPFNEQLQIHTVCTNMLRGCWGDQWFRWYLLMFMQTNC